MFFMVSIIPPYIGGFDAMHLLFLLVHFVVILNVRSLPLYSHTLYFHPATKLFITTTLLLALRSQNVAAINCYLLKKQKSCCY